MSDSVQKKIDNRNYTASVEQEAGLESPVTVTGDNYTVTFDGNDFQSKHLRRIRRNSVTGLKDPEQSLGKLQQYARESQSAGVGRFDGRERSTNTLIFLELGQFCQFGAQIIAFLKKDQQTPWTPFGNQHVLQKTVTVELNKCLAYASSGVGQFRQVSEKGGVNAGVGMSLTVVVQQVGANPKYVSVCHYDSDLTNVKELMTDPYFKRVRPDTAHGVATRIV